LKPRSFQRMRPPAFASAWLASCATFAALAILVGRVVDRTTGQPLTGVDVGVQDHPNVKATRTNDAGQYTLRGLAPGRYTITLSSDDVPPQTFELVVHPAKTQHFNMTACSTTLDYTCAGAAP